MKKDRELLIKAALDAMSATRIAAAIDALSGNDKGDVRESYISEKEARKYIGGITRTSIYRFRKKGLRWYSTGGRVLYKKSDLDEFVNDRTNLMDRVNQEKNKQDGGNMK